MNIDGFKRFAVAILSLSILLLILIDVTYLKIYVPELSSFIMAVSGIAIAYFTGQTITDYKKSKQEVFKNEQ